MPKSDEATDNLRALFCIEGIMSAVNVQVSGPFQNVFFALAKPLAQLQGT
jgi:hypothetical protein